MFRRFKQWLIRHFAKYFAEHFRQRNEAELWNLATRCNQCNELLAKGSMFCNRCGEFQGQNTDPLRKVEQPMPIKDFHDAKDRRPLNAMREYLHPEPEGPITREHRIAQLMQKHRVS